MIVAATLGSSAAVCSSSSSRLGSAMVAMSSDIAWRCPPESLLTPALQAVLEAHVRAARGCTRMTCRRAVRDAAPQPAALRRAAARWTGSPRWSSRGRCRRGGPGRPGRCMRLRTCSASLEMSLPPSSDPAAVTGNVPATTFSSVDLPEPFEPMMVMNSRPAPRGRCRSGPDLDGACRGRTSCGCPTQRGA